MVKAILPVLTKLIPEIHQLTDLMSKLLEGLDIVYVIVDTYNAPMMVINHETATIQAHYSTRCYTKLGLKTLREDGCPRSRTKVPQ